MRIRNLTMSPYQVPLVDHTMATVAAQRISAEIEPTEEFLRNMDTAFWAVETDADAIRAEDDLVEQEREMAAAREEVFDKDIPVPDDEQEDDPGDQPEELTAQGIGRMSKKQVIAELDARNVHHREGDTLSELRQNLIGFLGLGEGG